MQTHSSYCTATTNPAVISHRQVCRSALSSVIAEAAGPSEAPDTGPARTYGAYPSSGQPQVTDRHVEDISGLSYALETFSPAFGNWFWAS
jgi:hypothetical protein